MNTQNHCRLRLSMYLSYYYDDEEGLQCVSAYKIKLEKKLTKEYQKEDCCKVN